MWRRAEGHAEVTGEGEAIETAHFLEFVRSHRALRFRNQEIACPRDGAAGRARAPQPAAGVAAPRQQFGHAAHGGVDGERLERTREVEKRLVDDVGHRLVMGDGLGDEGRAGAIECLRHGCRIEVKHAIGEGAAFAGMAIVYLVGMQHQDLPGATGAQAATVAELLYAIEGEADAVGLVPVRVVGVATEARGQALQPGEWSVDADLVGGHARTFKTGGSTLLHMEDMIYDTKTALILRKDLAAWQVANVAAFLAGGLAGTHGYLMGEPYCDGNGRGYTALIREPVFVYGGSVEELRRTHQRALSRDLMPAIYIEAMFTTANDADNRAAVAAAPADALDFVGIGVHGPRKTIDKVVNGLKFLA